MKKFPPRRLIFRQFSFRSWQKIATNKNVNLKFKKENWFQLIISFFSQNQRFLWKQIWLLHINFMHNLTWYYLESVFTTPCKKKKTGKHISKCFFFLFKWEISMRKCHVHNCAFFFRVIFNPFFCNNCDSVFSLFRFLLQKPKKQKILPHFCNNVPSKTFIRFEKSKKKKRNFLKTIKVLGSRATLA